jgi:hypothetical protein
LVSGGKRITLLKTRGRNVGDLCEKMRKEFSFDDAFNFLLASAMMSEERKDLSEFEGISSSWENIWNSIKENYTEEDINVCLEIFNLFSKCLGEEIKRVTTSM